MADHPSLVRRAPAIFQTMFLIVFLGIGLLVTVLVAMNCWRGVRTYSWQQTTCAIESSEAVTRPEYGDFLFSASYRYEHRWEQFAGNRYREGELILVEN